jgi:AcrR family transcriptional regulator
MRTRLPASLETAWGLRPSPTKGPKRGLTLSSVVHAAVRVAGAEGLAALSMSRVADELGAATMSLYRYVAAKDELLALMVDAVFEQAPAARRGREGWRTALARWARAHRAVLQRHPWVIRVPISGPPITPNLVLWFERGLGCFDGLPLTAGQKISALLLVNGFVRNDAMLIADVQVAAHSSGVTMEQAAASYSERLGAVIDAERFPALSAALAEHVFATSSGPEDDFDFGLERLLDGIGAFVGRHQRRRS